MFFLISVCIVLYRHKKSGHHLVTKAAKIIVLLYASMCKKVSINNGFHSSRLLIVKIQILFFIPCRLRQARQHIAAGRKRRSGTNHRESALTDCCFRSGGKSAPCGMVCRSAQGNMNRIMPDDHNGRLFFTNSFRSAGNAGFYRALDNRDANLLVM
jgi:hypothetical protein